MVAKYCNEYACGCVYECLSVREYISGTTRAIFTKFCARCLWPRLGSPPAAMFRYEIKWNAVCPRLRSTSSDQRCDNLSGMARGLHNFTCHPHVYPRMEWAILHFRFVDDIMFLFYNGPYSGMNFTTKDRFRLNLPIYHKVGQNSISCY